jgi:SHS2 domain-containing protein
MKKGFMEPRGHETIDHTADMGIRGWGATPAEAFEEAAAAMLGLVAERSALGTSSSVRIQRRARDLTGLLLEFLNALIAEADVRALVFAEVAVDALSERSFGWEIEATAKGVSMAEARAALLIEVKAATCCGASVRRENGERWIARCVVDL